jgi:tetratricopeptide (TPR) repeat protein
VESNPDDPEAYYLYGRSLYLTGEIASARDSLDQALLLSGDAVDPDYVHLNGLLLAAEGDLQGAGRLLRNAFIRSNEYEHAMDWGRVAWQAYRLEEALEAYSAAADTDWGARSPWPHLNRGRLLTFLGRTEDAVAAYRQAIEVFEVNDTGEARPSPAYVEAYFRLGEIYESLGVGAGSGRYLQLALDSLSRRLP